MTVVQCLLARNVGDRKTEMVAWIPRELASRGNIVDLKEPDGSWSGPWHIITSYATILQLNDVRESQRVNLPSISGR